MTSTNMSIDAKLNKFRLDYGLHDDVVGWAKKLAAHLATWEGAEALDAFPIHDDGGFAERSVLVVLYGPGDRAIDFRIWDDTDYE